MESVLEWLVEFFVQIVGQVVVEFCSHSLREALRFPEPVRPWMAAFGYALLGAAAGSLSLWLFPRSFVGHGWRRDFNLVVTPVVAGALMVAMGLWRRRRGDELVRLDHFGYGYLFAFAMALTRYIWGK